MAEHTPGPWHISEETIGVGHASAKLVEIESDHGRIAQVYGANLSAFPETMPNAHLMAAAPELLALARQYRDDMRHGVHDEGSKARRLEVIEKILAKAEGR